MLKQFKKFLQISTKNFLENFLIANLVLNQSLLSEDPLLEEFCNAMTMHTWPDGQDIDKSQKGFLNENKHM